MTNEKEYIIQSRIKNNLLLKKILADSGSMLQFSKKHQFSYPNLMDFVNLKRTVIVNNKICPHALRLCEIFNSEPQDLFPKKQWDNAVKTNSISKELTESEFNHVISLESEMEESVYMIEDSRKDDELKEALSTTLDTLSVIEKKIVELRYGLMGSPVSMSDIVKELQGFKYIDRSGHDVVFQAQSTSRIRQIHDRAIKKLQHHKRSKILKEVFNK